MCLKWPFHVSFYHYQSINTLIAGQTRLNSKSPNRNSKPQPTMKSLFTGHNHISSLTYSSQTIKAPLILLTPFRIALKLTQPTMNQRQMLEIYIRHILAQCNKPKPSPTCTSSLGFNRLYILMLGFIVTQIIVLHSYTIKMQPLRDSFVDVGRQG